KKDCATGQILSGQKGVARQRATKSTAFNTLSLTRDTLYPRQTISAAHNPVGGTHQFIRTSSKRSLQMFHQKAMSCHSIGQELSVEFVLSNAEFPHQATVIIRSA